MDNKESSPEEQTCCGVPVDLHGTCCGWENAKAPCSAEMIISDTRHPGFGQHLNRWKYSYMDGSEDGYEVTEKSSYGSGWDAGYAAALKAKLTPSEPVEQKPFEDRLKDFINSQQDIPKEISEVVNRRFWDMLEGEQRFTIGDMRETFESGRIADSWSEEKGWTNHHTFDEWIKTH